MLNVVIPEPIPSLNKGEAAILRGLQEYINVYGENKLTIYSPSSWIDNDRKRYESEFNVVGGCDLWDSANNFLENPITRHRTHFFKTWGKLIVFSLITIVSKKLAGLLVKDDLFNSLANADLIVVGHDGMLSYNHFWVVLSAKIMRRPIAILGSGTDAGKRHKKWRLRKFLQYVIDNSIICTVRDSHTREYLIANDISPEKVHLFPDPAVLMKPSDSERVKELMKTEKIPNCSEKPLFGLIPVRGGVVFDNSFSSETNIDRKHSLRVQLWVDIILHLFEITNAHFVLLPHCIGPGIMFDDRRMNRDVYDAIPEGKERITIINNEYSESELKGLMKNCEFVLGERAHGLIGSFSIGTPLVALTVKEDLRMHYIINNMFKRKTFNLNNPDADELKNLLTEEWNNRKVTASQMISVVKDVHEEALEAARMLKESIEKVMGKKK